MLTKFPDTSYFILTSKNIFIKHFSSVYVIPTRKLKKAVLGTLIEWLEFELSSSSTFSHIFINYPLYVFLIKCMKYWYRTIVCINFSRLKQKKNTQTKYKKHFYNSQSIIHLLFKVPLEHKFVKLLSHTVNLNLFILLNISKPLKYTILVLNFFDKLIFS